MGLFGKKLATPTVRPNVWTTESGEYLHFSDVAFKGYNRRCRLCAEKIYLDYGQHMVLHNDGCCNALFHRECFDPWARKHFKVRGRDGKSIVHCPRCSQVVSNVCPGVLPKVPVLPPKKLAPQTTSRYNKEKQETKRSWWC